MTLKEMRERSRELVSEMKKMRDAYHTAADEGKSGDELWSENTEKRWKEINAEYDELKRKIEEEEAAAERARQFADLDNLDQTQDQNHDRQANQTIQHEDRALALRAWAGRQISMCRTDRHMEACQRVGIDPDAREMEFVLNEDGTYYQMQHLARTNRQAAEQRALSVGIATAGGNVVPQGFVPSLEINMLAVGGVEPTAEVMLTENGQDLPWPTVNDTANEGEIIGENVATASNEDPAFGQVVMKAYIFSSKLVSVSNSLLQDNAVNLGQLLGQLLGTRIGRLGNRKFTGGTGTNEPTGIVTAATQGLVGAVGAAIAPDEVIDLQHSVDPAYRADPSFGFMAHDNIIAALRKLKDTTNRYLWADGLNTGQPDRLNGVPIFTNQHMDSAVAVNNKTILAGAFSKYKIRRVRSVIVQRLVERSADKFATDFVLFVRQDGNLLDAGTAPVKYLQQAAV